MVSDAKRKANAKYDATHTIFKTFKFNKKTDADIINKLDSVPNQTGYLKGLIRADIGKETQNESIKREPVPRTEDRGRIEDC